MTAVSEAWHRDALIATLVNCCIMEMVIPVSQGTTGLVRELGIGRGIIERI